MTTLRRKLSKKDVPYLVTAFAAITAWAINHIVDRAIGSPTIEYKTQIVSQGSAQLVKVALTNLSRQAFFGLKFEIQAPDAQLCETLPEYIPPAWPSKKQPEPGTGGITFLVEQFHPDWEMTICAKLKKGVDHQFLLRETGVRQAGESSKQAVRLVKPSVETFLVRCNMFLMGLLATASLSAFLYWLVRSEDIE